MRVSLKLLFVTILSIAGLSVNAQFYNGHQMQFGKNRVQYSDFYWTYYRFERFDTYFNEHGAQLAKYTSEFAREEITRLEGFFDYTLDGRIIFIVYNKLSDFRQSNIGLVTGKAETNIGGTIQIDKNKVFLYFEGDYKKFEQQITAAICKVLINEMVYGSQFRDNAANSTLINLPEWYMDGLIAYLSKGWGFEVENKVKDGVLSGKYKKFNRLVGDDAKYAGHSFWKYITESYGESIIPSILYLTKINKNANSGFFYVVGSPLKELSRNWYAYNLSIYESQEQQTSLPDDEPIRKRPRKKRVYQNIRLSPSGNYMAYTTNHMGRYKIWLYDAENDKHKKLLRKEHKLEQITDYSYPVLAWHPSGPILTFITEEEGGLKMYYYTLAEKELTRRNVLYFEKVLSYSFSPDGSLLVLSAVKDGKSDIFIQNIAAGSNFQVTNDIADDFSPRFTHDGTKVIFASNRETDSLSSENNKETGGLTRDLFIYNYAGKADKLNRLSDIKYINKNQPYEVGVNKFISLSDKNGIINRYVSKFDSTIAYVDTAVHYRYFALTSPSTNYARNIQEHNFSPKSKRLGEIVFKNGRYYMYARNFDEKEFEEEDVFITPFRKQKTSSLMLQDSLNKRKILTIPLDSLLSNEIIYEMDTISVDIDKIDVNNYIFEIERIKMLNEQFREQDINIEVVDGKRKEKPRAKIYQLAFYQNFFTSQIDFSFLSESYQPFTGGAVYFNPGTNLLFKIGTHDLFSDYKITAGIRIPLDFESSEYLISFETLKRRLNKQVVFHRQTFVNNTTGEEPENIRNITHQLYTVLRYPFSQVTSVAATFGVRNDKQVYLPLGSPQSSVRQLQRGNTEKLWLSTKGEYVFDNTRSLGLNLRAGSRFKIFAEAYQKMNTSYDNLFVIGADFRSYTVIHRNLIWANRFAASGSLGSARLIYYLGGVDNWTNFSSRNPTFIPLNEIRITPGQSYAFQTVATNMRGFSQNIRNGSNFALINSEIRWPIIRYIANYPLSNAFLENLQVIGFFDVGSAWSGFSPWSKKNGYDRDYVRRGSVEIEIDAEREPFVAGYGFGVRSQLLGYFIRLDWAWGIENMQVLPRVFYFSLALDF